MGFNLSNQAMEAGFFLASRFNNGLAPCGWDGTDAWMRLADDLSRSWADFVRDQTVASLDTIRRRRRGELGFRSTAS